MSSMLQYPRGTNYIVLNVSLISQISNSMLLLNIYWVLGSLPMWRKDLKFEKPMSCLTEWRGGYKINRKT